MSDNKAKRITPEQCRRRFGDAATELILGDIAESKSRTFKIGTKLYYMD